MKLLKGMSKNMMFAFTIMSFMFLSFTLSGSPVYSAETVTIEGIPMVLIPEGSFEMGSDEGAENEKPVHTVSLDAFYMSTAEVTNSQYSTFLNAVLASGDITATTERVTGAGGAYDGKEFIYLVGEFNANNKCWITFNDSLFSVVADKENLPVVFVTWYGAKAFTEYYGFDLPTEAEWEYAARGGQQYVYGTDDGTISSAKVNYNYSYGRLKDVMSYLENPYGLNDLSGNVSELCLDWYDNYTSESVHNPVGSHTGTSRAIRGGNWQTSETTCRTSYRTSTSQDNRNANTGFRVVLHIYTIQGKILEKGYGISGVAVRITGEGFNETVTTGSEGNYSVILYAMGSYLITPSKNGYMFNPVNTSVTVSEILENAEDIHAIQTGSTVSVDMNGISFVYVPAGSFDMGSDDGEQNEKPVHMVTLEAYYISMTEITNAHYSMFLNAALASGDISVTDTEVTGVTGPYSGHEYFKLSGYYDFNNKCRISYSDGLFSVESGRENLPVVYVTWYGAKAFSDYYGFNLPTEAEWEYAARGGQQYEFGTDDGTISSSKANYNYAVGHPVDVKSYPANPFGLYDMAGNVRELCLDWYESYTSDSVYNPIGPHTGSNRALRGGHWSGSENVCRASYRSAATVDQNGHIDGFRIVRHIRTLQGRVLESGLGLADVSVTLTGQGVDETVMTDSNGYYTFYGLNDGTYTITPEKSTFIFKPLSLEVTVTETLQFAQDIRAVPEGLIETIDIEGVSCIYIPSGTFMMGSDEGEANEKPVHSVTVDAYYISTTEITNEKYSEFLNAALSSGDITVTDDIVYGSSGTYNEKEYISLVAYYNAYNRCWISYSEGSFSVATGKEKMPVVYVTWYGARAFAEYYGFDLPTEAEWEYAARGGQQYEYGTDDGTISGEKANYGNSIGYPIDVQSYSANLFGLYDMSGNVTELCLDWYDNYSSESVLNPVGPHSGDSRALRGGNWKLAESTCRTAYRVSTPVDSKSYLTGFRVVRHILIIQGRIIENDAGVAGISVSVAGENVEITGTTDSNGIYTLNVFSTGLYTITPAGEHYLFDPVSIALTVDETVETVDNINANLLEPPFDITVTDIPDDQGHKLTLSWTLSPDDDIVSHYNIYRSRNSEFTEPMEIDSFNTLEELLEAEKNSVILITTVPRGTTSFEDEIVPLSGVPYYYWLQSVAETASSQKAAAGFVTGVQEKPSEFRVSAPYPNPFNPSTTIEYELPQNCRVRLVIYDILGREVTVIKDGMDSAGVHSAVWYGMNRKGIPVASGVYIYQLIAGKHRALGKVMLLR